MAATGMLASFVPADPVRVLVLAHGFPWLDGSQSDGDLAAYAQAAVGRWAPFAVTHRAIVLAPVFGGTHFGGYRALFGRRADADDFVNAAVDRAGAAYIPHFSGRFSLHGHSAGAQFAGRYLVTHPRRLEAVVLSAPAAYPFPDPDVPWPDGMAAVLRGELSGSPGEGKAPERAAGSLYTPDPAGWLIAASEVPAVVLVGSRDTVPQAPEPRQLGATRIERATGWIDSMRRHAGANGRPPGIRLLAADGLDHDETAMAVPAQEIFAQIWAESLSRH